MNSVGLLLSGWAVRWPALALVLCLAAVTPGAQAHKASDAYLGIGEVAAPAQQDATVALRLSLALKDLDAALPTLDADGDRRLTWGEVRRARPQIVRWVEAGLTLRCARTAVLPAWAFEALEQRSDGAYLRLAARLPCEPQAAIAVDYRLMQDVDPTHRLLLQSELDGQLGGQRIAAVLAPNGRSAIELPRHAEPAMARIDEPASGEPAVMAGPAAPAAAGGGIATLANFFFEGIHHILSGYDHLAFLLALLLPISLARRVREAGVTARRGGLGQLLFTITGFTVGHSVTLALATLGWITASPAWVEPAIAITIGVSAALNLYPVRGLRTDVLAAGFGLVHGLGFAAVMTEAGVSGPLLAWALAGFNLGVEAGQLMVVAAWCAVHLLLLRWSHYPAVVVRGGSFALLLLAVYWTIPRLMG